MQLPIIQAARPILGVFSLETFTVAVAQSVDFTDNGRRLSVVTSPQQWAYAVVFPLLSEIATDPSELIEIHVRVRLLDGKVGIGVLRPDESAFIDESFRGPHPKSTDVVLYVEGGQAIGRLVVRNAEQGELVSRIEIEEIRVLASERPEQGSYSLQAVTRAPFTPQAPRSRVFDLGAISTTEACNLSCVMCHFNGPRVEKKFGTLDAKLVEKALVQIPPGREVWFGGTGELFMDPNALTYLRRASEFGLRPCILTHGQTLTSQLIDAVLEAGVRLVRISADSTDPDEFRKIRRGGELSRILDACAYMRERKADYPDLRVEISCTLLHTTFPKQDEMVAFWRGKVDAVDFNAEYFRTFRYRNIFFEPPRRVDCALATYVLPSGRISPCCAVTVYQHEHDVSWLPHIAETSLQEAYDRLCDMYEDPDSPLATLCRSCEWWIMWAHRDNMTPYGRHVKLDAAGVEPV
jgi:Radical SAM superfamily